MGLSDADPFAPWRVATFATAAGASLSLAVLATAMAAATRRLAVWGTLALVGIGAFGYLAGAVAFLCATDPEQALRWARLSLAPTPAIVWGIWYLSRHVPVSTRRLVGSGAAGPVAVLAVTASLLVLADAALDLGWVVRAVVDLPRSLRFRVIEPGPAGLVFFLGALAVLYVSAVLLLLARREQNRPSLTPIAVGTILYFATLTNDFLLVVGAYDAPFLNGMGFFAMYSGFCVYFGHLFVDNAQRLRRAHEELRKHRQVAVHASRLRSMGTLAAFVAHELGNDLQVVENVSLGLIHRTPPEVADEDLADLRLATRHMAQVLRGLRRMSRDHREDAPAERQALADLVEDAARLVAPMMRRHGVRLGIQPPVPGTDTVEVRAAEIMQVVMNLLKNAADAARESDDPQVSVRFEIGPAHVHLRVADNGPGIPEDLRERIFEPFFTTKPSDEGTGIGLAVVRQIVLDHDGAIHVDVEEGWTHFVVTLPRAGEVRNGTEPPAKRRPSGS